MSPDKCARFEAEFAEALSRAGVEFDLAPAEAVLDRWWGIAVIRANPLSEAERAQVARARDGVFDGLWERDEPRQLGAALAILGRYSFVTWAKFQAAACGSRAASRRALTCWSMVRSAAVA